MRILLQKLDLRTFMDEKSNELIYVACAFCQADPEIRQQRIDNVSRFCAEKMRQGVVVFCPLIHNYHILKYGLPIGWSYWEQFNKELLKRCDRLYVLKLEDWEKSVGLQAEVAIARSLNIPIEYHEYEAPADFTSSFLGNISQ